MHRQLLEAARKIELSADAPSLWSVFVAALREFGLDHALYLYRSDEKPSETFVLSTLPDNWPAAEFRRSGFSEPFLSYCCATFEITKVGMEFLSDHQDYVESDDAAYISRMAEFNWRSGLGIPCRLTGTGYHGGFVVGNHLDRFSFERKTLPLAAMLQSFCLIAHGRLEILRAGLDTEKSLRPLSARERQVLDFISQGMRPKAIAHELEISEASVRLYLKNARVKMDADTKEAAVAASDR